MRPRVNARNRPEPMEDEELQQLITERIEEDPVFWTGSGRRRTYVTVEVEDGHVILSGVVRSAMDRRRADILARALGATTVDNRLGIAEESAAKEKAKRWWRKQNVGDRMQETGNSLSLSFSCLPPPVSCFLSFRLLSPAYPPHSPNTLRIHSNAGCPMGAPGGASGTD